MERHALVALLQDDTTQPLDWASAAALAEVERQYFSRRDFAGFQQFCEELLDQAAFGPEARCLVLHNALNGRRRVPEAKTEDVLQFAALVVAEVERLPEGTHRNWLTAMVNYGLGVFCRDIGKFRLAAQYQTVAAEAFERLGDTKSTVISWFLAAVERCNDALVKDEDIAKAVEDLEDAYRVANRVLAGHAWLVNVYLHAIHARVWAGSAANTVYEVRDHALDHLAEMEYGQATFWAHWLRLVAAIRLVEVGDYAMALATLRAIVERSEADKQGDVTCTALLMLARLERGYYNDPVAATATARRLDDWTGNKGRVPQAIGRREFADLLAQTDTPTT